MVDGEVSRPLHLPLHRTYGSRIRRYVITDLTTASRLLFLFLFAVYSESSRRPFAVRGYDPLR